MAKQQTLHCSFCGRNRDEVKILIAGQDGHICENCVEHAEEIIEQELGNAKENKQHATPANKLTVRKPIEIKKFLDDYVIGQEDAKKIVKLIKDSGIKVQVAIMDDIIRVTGKKIDDLQEVIQASKTWDLGLALQFVNMKS